eukprot:scaffold18233_cov55-Skeletonema_dohrnii-CCMP3373.AAC.2
MRPNCRSRLYSLVLFVLVAYCLWQQHELDHLREIAPTEYENVNQAIAVENLPPPSATHNTKVSYVTNFWAKVKGGEIHPHRREVEAALLANIHNPHFDQ